ncbi:MarR family winged helix-turn-helix transcriptional regulator [Mycolicibacterium sp. F2034L]|uniref:MarR family winged helix-turn-helix transcriptional regulator n=1 Tax=Mycolicibacterium sp. F2034L TaxID=2926422 RepID=UPI001FF10C15|nr:MarR family winged helix-turn-helix transcriptional regulator [Mycolicibacterium sp. F2034L]MCK0173658.1 MarR family winged helix-turn-helix transcriptional regulator [Mycolicibacterium sp. F2034L]
MASTRWLTDDEQQAWRAYIAMQQTLSRHLHQHLQRDFDLSDSDFEILVNLSEADGARLRPVDLAAATQWEKSRLSHHLSRMAARGLVAREPGEGRYPVVVLTDAGRAALEACAPANAARVRELFIDVIGPERLEVLRGIAEDVVAAVETHRGTDCSLA